MHVHKLRFICSVFRDIWSIPFFAFGLQYSQIHLSRQKKLAYFLEGDILQGVLLKRDSQGEVAQMLIFFYKALLQYQSSIDNFPVSTLAVL